MPVKRPDRYEHTNSDYAFLSVDQLEGLQIVNTLAERDQIPLDKRGGLNTQIFLGTQRHTYLIADISDIEWENPNNWNVQESFGVIEETPTITDATTGLFSEIDINRDNAGFFTDVKVALLGSSSMAGTGSEGEVNIEGALDLLLSEFCDSYTLTNLAVGGYTTYELMPTGFSEVARPAPDPNANITYAVNTLDADIVVIFSPSNDIVNGYSVDEVLRNFQRIRDEAVCRGIKVIVCDLNPSNFFTEGEETNQLELAFKLQVLFKRNYASWLPHLATGVEISWDDAYYGGDGTHGNRIAQAEYAQKVSNEVFNILLESTILAYTSIERSLDGITYTTITKLGIEDRVFRDYNVAEATDYYYQARFISNINQVSQYSDPIMVTPVDSGTTIQVNVGPLSNLGILGWNDYEVGYLTPAAVGNTYPLVDSLGQAVAAELFTLESIDAPGSGGVTFVGTEFTPESGETYAFQGGTVTYKTIRVINLPTSTPVEVKILGARDSTANDRVGEYDVSGNMGTLDAAGNSSNFITLAGVTDGAGTLDIKFKAAAGSIFGYINAFKIKY